MCSYYCPCQFGSASVLLPTVSGWLWYPGLILPDGLRFGNAGNLQNLVHIIGEKVRYIEPFLAENEHGCQGGGSYKGQLCEAKPNNTHCATREFGGNTIS